MSGCLAYDVADSGFNVTWKKHSINWRLEQHTRVILDGLGRRLPFSALSAVVKRIGAMKTEVPPAAIPGIHETLAELSIRYRLAILSDAIVPPGTGLRELATVISRLGTA